jgi:hypothetical protein
MFENLSQYQNSVDLDACACQTYVGQIEKSYGKDG